MSATASKRLFGRPAYALSPLEIDWRRSRLSKIGVVDEDDVEKYANVPELDLHDVERLVDAGCDLDLALEILS